MAAEIGSGVDVEHHHHHHTGNRWLDITLAVSAITISLISLFLAIQHGRVMEKMVEAETWAYVTAFFSTAEYDYTPHVRLTIANRGVGPATVETLEVFYDGVAQPGSNALVGAMLKSTGPFGHQKLLRSDVIGMVLSAKEELNFLDFNLKAFTPEEYATLVKEVQKLEFKVCYCSVLEECSMLDTTKGFRPARLKACPVPKTPFKQAF